MPWCEPCDAFYNPNSLAEDGRCPRCGREVTEGDFGFDRDRDGESEDAAALKVPWHFWVGVAAMVLYLGWRVIQGIAWFF